MAADEPPEVVASAGPLDPVVVALREFLHRSGAIRAVAVVEGEVGEGAAVVDCGRLEPIAIEAAGRRMLLPHAAELDADVPALPDVRRLPPFEVDRERAEIGAPPGGVAHLAAAVRDLADLLGGRNVAMAQFETTDPDTPLAISSRAGGGEPIVIALGEEQFEMEPGWPPPA